MRIVPILAAVPLLLLAGCGSGEPIAGNAISQLPDAPASPVEVVATDATSRELRPVEAADAKALDGELACSFTRDGEDRPILIGRADVGREAHANAVVRVGDRAEMLAGRLAGGFDAMARGIAFSGSALTATVERHVRQATGDESTAHDATLVIQRGDGDMQRIDGLWTCGP